MRGHLANLEPLDDFDALALQVALLTGTVAELAAELERRPRRWLRLW
jgi:hypothetical protein